VARRRLSAGIARLLGCAFALLLVCLACPTLAAQERYDYDALGRLIRVIDEQGRVTEYVYDAAGNILQVTGAGTGSAQAPVITAIAPATVRRNRVRTLQVTGSGLQGVRLSVADPALDISNVTVSPTNITFTLAAAGTAALGNHTITFANAAGAVQGTITVTPPVDYVLTPNPLALPPDNVARQFYLVASEADTEPITLTASTLNPAIARTGNVPITLAAGQTQATGTITGIAVGIEHGHRSRCCCVQWRSSIVMWR
jgi:YD repeat-containing protein